MLRRTFAPLMIVTTFLAASACSSPTDPGDLKEFSTATMPNPETLVPGVEATSALSILYIQGLMRTPSPCYELSGDFSRSGSNLTLRVHAAKTNETECGTSVGGFRYTAVVNGLSKKTYQLKVIHTIENGTGGEFNLPVTVVQ